MADNVAVTPGAGATIATDDVSGVQFQKIKLDLGADGATVPATGDGTNGLDVDVTRVQGTVTTSISGAVDTELPAAAALTDTVANPTTPSVGAAGLVFDGTNWQRARTAASTADANDGTKIPAKVNVLFNGTTYDKQRTVQADDTVGTGILAANNADFNGTNYDRRRNNVTGTALASAARTATTSSADLVNYNHLGVAVVLDVTAGTSLSLTLRVEGKDPASGKYWFLNAAPTAVTGTGTTVYTVYPGGITVQGGVTQVAPQALPRNWRITVTHGNANSATYVVGYSLSL